LSSETTPEPHARRVRDAPKQALIEPLKPQKKTPEFLQLTTGFHYLANIDGLTILLELRFISASNIFKENFEYLRNSQGGKF
jgi:hypothetical protein